MDKLSFCVSFPVFLCCIWLNPKKLDALIFSLHFTAFPHIILTTFMFLFFVFLHTSNWSSAWRRFFLLLPSYQPCCSSKGDHACCSHELWKTLGRILSTDGKLNIQTCGTFSKLKTYQWRALSAGSWARLILWAFCLLSSHLGCKMLAVCSWQPFMQF